MPKISTRIICSLASAVLFVLTPSSTLADGVSTDGAATSPTVLITELQTGSSTSGKDEFVELYNNSSADVDIANWQLRYISSSSASASPSSPTQTIFIAPGTNGHTILPAGGYFLLHTATIMLPQGATGQTYTYTLPATGGNLVLLKPDAAPCTLDVDDTVAWGTGTLGEGGPIVATPKDADYQRYVEANGNYYETYDNARDFGVGAPTPAAVNTATTTSDMVGVIAPEVTTINDSICTPLGGSTTGATSGDGQTGGTNTLQAPTDGDLPPEQTLATNNDANATHTASASNILSLPAADNGLIAPQLTEILPNPAPPQTDADDEFIELYNANDVAFDLSGFRLVAGIAAQHAYAFPAGTTLLPRSFVAFFSVGTNLSLSNGGGQVMLEDPSGKVLGQTAVYGAAKDGQAWALTKGSWAWTATPTPNAPNAITAPVITTKATKATTISSKKATAKTTTTGSKTKTSTAANDTATTASLAASASPTPIHAGVLAFAALFALLYGAYEYRRDVANRFHQLRSYRNARREARTRLARRRSG